MKKNKYNANNFNDTLAGITPFNINCKNCGHEIEITTTQYIKGSYGNDYTFTLDNLNRVVDFLVKCKECKTQYPITLHF